MLWRSSVALLLLSCGFALIQSLASPAVRAQEPVMYVQPDTGSVHDTFTFFGWGFAPGWGPKSMW